MSSSRGVQVGAWGMVVVAAGILVFLWVRRPGPPPKPNPDSVPSSEDVRQYLRTAESLFERRNFREARKVGKAALGVEPDSPRALLIVADASAEMNDTRAALEYYGQVTAERGEQYWVRARFGMALIHFYSGSYATAEELLTELLMQRPTHATANALLAEILNVEGRRWASVPYAIELVRQGRAGLEALLLLADSTYIITHTRRAEEALARDPGDVGPVFGLARAALDEGNHAKGLELLQKVRDARPDWVEPQAVYGSHLLDNEPEKFAEWHAALSETADTHPDIWLVRARWYQRAGHAEAASRCFWEVLRRNPNNQQAHFQLATLLQGAGRPEDARAFVDRGLQLERLQKALEEIIAGGDRSAPDLITDVAVVLEALGRGFEARNWVLEAQKRRGESPSFRVERSPAATMRDRLALWVRPDSNSALFVDLSDIPLPDIDGSRNAVPARTTTTHSVRFEDQAEVAGLRFSYVAAPDDSTDGKRVIELTGGGAGAIDFDRDGRPDVFLTQGGLWPDPGDPAHTDRLFRNVDGTAFVDVTQPAGAGGTGFGQGLAAGDVNADGFPDLFVANLGRNRLLLNNGDGTFSDATHNLGDDYADWTTSAVIADFTGDGLPDLYVTNYLQDSDQFREICRPNPDAVARICTPDQFEAAQDRLFINRGDGTFEDRTESSGIVLPQGKGLGVLAADFVGDGTLQLFVANDGVPNFFFRRDDSDEVRFVETATLAGLAMSGEGRAQACMGVAAGDANADGQLDLFVTNFHRESNTLYVGTSGLFEDVSRTAGLREPSYRLLGFGTQFLDGELDGDPDLVLTNGHVDDFTHTGAGYRMRAQYMRNLGNGRFGELTSEAVGSFFDIQQLGRGLCRLDWNGDGLEDFVVSHLETPVALVTNVSESAGHHLAVRLVPTTGDRDATGARVSVTSGDWTRVRQRVAGDGYQCANEAKLVFGLGARESVEKLQVRWSDGSVSSFSNVDVDQSVVIVQGCETVFQQPK